MELTQDERLIAGGLNARRPSGDELVALMRTVRRKLDMCREQGSVTPLMEFVYSNITSASSLLSDIPIACGAGCSHCCHIAWVDATPAEVLFAVKSMTPEQRLRVTAAVERVSERKSGKSLEERSAIVAPCPLLEDNKCSVYGDRPIVCRSLVSVDSEACKRAYIELSGENISSPTVWRTLGSAYVVALEGAILHAGLVPTPRDWNESLRSALNDPGAEARWLAGEDVFSDAPRTTTSSAFDAPSWAYLYRQAFGVAPPRRM